MSPPDLHTPRAPTVSCRPQPSVTPSRNGRPLVAGSDQPAAGSVPLTLKAGSDQPTAFSRQPPLHRMLPHPRLLAPLLQVAPIIHPDGEQLTVRPYHGTLETLIRTPRRPSHRERNGR